MRRTRQYPWLRDMVAETVVTPHDLILPLFIREEEMDPMIPGLEGIKRLTVSECLHQVEEALRHHIPAVILFPCVPTSLKTMDGDEALNPDNLVCRTLKTLKNAFGNAIGLITDVALDAYTTHGHDGVIQNKRVDNDPTLEKLVRQSLIQVEAGSDIIAPSDMMDGRVTRIRSALDDRGYQDKLIMSYAVKYASTFYETYRAAVGAGKVQDSEHSYLCDKRTYQQDYRNLYESLHEVSLDVNEGADMLLVKPGVLYLDVLHQVKKTFQMPTFVFHLAGEVALLKCASAQGLIRFDEALMETMIAFKRAGADSIITYAALDVAKILLRDAKLYSAYSP